MKRVLFVAMFVLMSTGICNSQNPRPTTISLTQFPSLVAFVGSTPQQVYNEFGRPREAHVERYCCRIGDYAGDTLVHVYDAEGGGVIAFLYGQYTQGVLVNGVVFDNLDALNFWRLADFFPDGAPRDSRLAACLAQDFHHQLPTDPGVKQISEKVLWTAPRGHVFFARYRSDGQFSEKYDAVSGQDIASPVDDVDRLRLLQWGYFVGTPSIMDLHLGVHHGQNTDYTLGPWNGPGCVR